MSPRAPTVAGNGGASAGRLLYSPLMSSQLGLGGPHSAAARPTSRGVQHQTRSRVGATRPGSYHPLAQSQVSLVSPRGEALPVPPSVLDAPPELGALLLSRSPVELLLEREQQEKEAGVPPLTAGLRVSEWIYTEMGPRLPPDVRGLLWKSQNPLRGQQGSHASAGATAAGADNFGASQLDAEATPNELGQGSSAS